MIEEKWRVLHSKNSDYTYHYMYNPVKVSQYVTSNRFEGISVVYNWNVFNLDSHQTIVVKS